MSFVIDQVRRIDGHLDRIAFESSDNSCTDTVDTADADANAATPPPQHHISEHAVPRILELQHAIKSLSTTSDPSRPLASVWKVSSTLRSAALSASCPTCDSDPARDSSPRSDVYIVEHEPHSGSGGNGGDGSADGSGSSATYEHQLEWLLLCKATAQGYGQVLHTILAQTLELNAHTWYWDDILGSPRWAGVYSVQTSPLRLWRWTRGVLLDVRARNRNGSVGLSEGWRVFYGLVRQAVRQRSLVDLQARVVSPLAQVRNEARRKQKEIRRLREVNANALGVLLGEGLASMEDAVYTAGAGNQQIDLLVAERRDHVVKSIVLMESVLSQVGHADVDADSFEERISAATAQDIWTTSLDSGHAAGDIRPSEVSLRLQTLLNDTLARYTASFRTSVQEVGTPPRLIRYWLPATVLLLSSTTLLRIAVNRKAELITWVQELGTTVRDFWLNWVVEPTKRILGTIRHDEGSEVAIMSKRSLEGDRDSLERMVVDFVRDAPENGTLSEAQLQDVRLKIREGDLTPVLKAYERDMQKPVMGALRGNLIRALLIQVQKTKVDVEVAMGGIDSLLKSQELVFGFVGLTPGLLVVFGTVRWLNSTFVDRKGSALGQKRGRILAVLRNIDRILTSAVPSKDGALYYKDYGLLLCEAHILRQIANQTFPSKEFRDFLVDLEELTDMQIGLERQKKVVSRIRWGYSRWL